MNKTVPISKWFRFNLEEDNASLRVREGFRQLVDLGSNEVVGFHSLRSDITDEVWHYVAYVTSAGALKIGVYDELFQALYNVTWSETAEPPAGSICFSELLGAIYITAPGLEMVWGYVGGGLQVADVFEGGSFDPDITLLDIPRGVSVAWGSRLVVSDGFGLYFSEPGRPRSYNAANLVNPPGGSIYGLEVGVDGDLLISTTTGTWSLSRRAGEQGFFMLNVPFQRVSDAKSVGYGQHARGDGRLWSSHRDGIRLADARSEYIEYLRSPSVTPGRFDPINVDDFRNAVLLFGDDHGAYVALVDRDDFWFGGSWHNGISLRGVGYDQFGRTILADKNGLYLWFGNHDDGDTQIWGAASGNVLMAPEDNLVIREVHVMTDGLAASCTSGSDQDTEEKTTPASQLYGLRIGTDTWTSSTTYRTPPLRSQRFRWDDRSDEHALEVGVRGGRRRLGGRIDVRQEGVGRKRPT
jgi:hypothetical protein